MKWIVDFPEDKHMLLDSNTPHEDLQEMGHTEYALTDLNVIAPSYKKTESILIKLSPHDKYNLSELAHKHRVSMGQMVRTLILQAATQEGIETHPNLYELFN